MMTIVGPYPSEASPDQPSKVAFYLLIDPKNAGTENNIKYYMTPFEHGDAETLLTFVHDFQETVDWFQDHQLISLCQISNLLTYTLSDPAQHTTTHYRNSCEAYKKWNLIAKSILCMGSTNLFCSQLQMATDFHQLNKQLVCHLLPKMEDIFQRLDGFNYVSNMDLK
jgi:hypothetical protein